MTNVVRFPVERRRRPTLDLLREIAPDPRDVDLLIETFSIDCPANEVRAAADRAMAEYILNHVDREPGQARAQTLQLLLTPIIEQAVEACRTAHEAAAAATAACEVIESARAEGRYWLAPLEARADDRTREAARLLVEAYVASEEAEGAARAVGLAGRGEEWRPFDVRAETAALFGLDSLAG